MNIYRYQSVLFIMALELYATPEDKYGNRFFEEDESSIRKPFSRDRDRIIHSKAFRRLEYKTQVFVNHLGDNFRTRLTHSIEVAQIARTVANILNISESLAETIALAHDLGHPPFGHVGERVLHDLMKNHGGFNHNTQTLRIVEVLEERYPSFMGLNLTKATILGLQKHEHLPNNHSHSIEAQVVDICDEIAYNNHDIDDGLDSGLITLEQLHSVEIWKQQWKQVVGQYPNVSDKIKIRTTIRAMIHAMVLDLVEHTKGNIQKYNISTFDDVLSFKVLYPEDSLVHFSPTMLSAVVELKTFLHRELYKHPTLLSMKDVATDTIHTIFQRIEQDIILLPIEYQQRIKKDGEYRCICDFIAGMTDRYALRLVG